MGYLRSNIKMVANKKYLVEIFYSSYYFWEYKEEKEFEFLSGAMDWLLQKRTYERNKYENINIKFGSPKIPIAPPLLD